MVQAFQFLFSFVCLFLFTSHPRVISFRIGTDRETETLSFLKKFQSKLSETRVTKLDESVDNFDNEAWSVIFSICVRTIWKLTDFFPG